MNYRIDRSLPDPAYLQLYRLLAADIAAGVYPFGSRLPGKRAIAEETGLSVVTAEHALALLSDEGYIELRQRSGSFVLYRREEFPEEAPALPVRISEPVPSRVTGGFPFPLLARTMRKVLLDYGDRILTKSPNHGCPELREEICRYLARSRGLSVEPAQVIVGSGAEYLYGLIVQLLGTDAVYGLEDPSYGKIRAVYEALGARCDLLAMTADGIATAELARTEARILHVTPFHSFPSGVTAGISKKLEYLRWAGERGGVLIEDNYDSELTVSKKPEAPLCSMAGATDVIYLNTFSRTVAPSMRIGYMILPPRLLERFDRRLGFYSCTVPIFDQYVLAELLRSGEFERHLRRQRRARRSDAGLQPAPLSAIL